MADDDLKERFCWHCGASLGVIARKYYDRLDTCGARECEREANYQCRIEDAERDDRA